MGGKGESNFSWLRLCRLSSKLRSNFILYIPHAYINDTLCTPLPITSNREIIMSIILFYTRATICFNKIHSLN